MNSPRSRILHWCTVASLVALILLGLAWELYLAPLGGKWMALKVLPLLIPLRGVIKRDVYTLQWTSMLILLYFAEGIVRATSDRHPLTPTLGWIEVILSCILFFCALMYLRPYKKAAKQLARQAIEKASK